jgi:hypothetical protein
MKNVTKKILGSLLIGVSISTIMASIYVCYGLEALVGFTIAFVTLVSGVAGLSLLLDIKRY